MAEIDKGLPKTRTKAKVPGRGYRNKGRSPTRTITCRSYTRKRWWCDYRL